MDTPYYEQCESEKLHLSGKVQPHGALLILSKEEKLTHFSENIKLILPSISPLEIGKELPEALSPLMQHLPSDSGSTAYTFLKDADGNYVDLAVTKATDAFLIEVYPANTSEKAQSQSSFKLPSSFNNEQEKTEYRDQLISWISEITGHQRVMYYQFLENGDGHVIAEICTDPSIGSYLDLRFPASDIPQIARQLYTQTQWREIPEAQATSISLKGIAQVPDLTLTDLRSVSPVHQQYMMNMGVGSSVSFPIIKSGELSALISCHSSDPLKIPLASLRRISEAIYSYVLLVNELDSRLRLSMIDEFNIRTQPLRNLLNSGSDLEEVWEDLAFLIKDNLGADGIVMCSDDWALLNGQTFDSATLDVVDQWFQTQNSLMTFQTDNLSGLIDNLPLTEVAGLAYLRFRAAGTSQQIVRVYLCRGEHIHEVKWGGNPNKPVESTNNQLKISPRQSFSKWIENRLGYSKPWPGMLNLELHRLRGLLESSSVFIQEP
jgi:light-regulated signal transduction histidine kinase (bacteriophytochrome)